MKPNVNLDFIKKLKSEINGLDEVAILKRLTEIYPGRIAFSTSFGEEDQVITHFIFANNLPIRVFSLDTGRLFEETFKTFSKTIEKYNQKIDVYFPENQDIEKLYKNKGVFSFYESVENRKECCQIRKVKPLTRALKDVDCWITGLRASQSEGRQDMDMFEYDPKFDLIKFNPLINWSLEKVQQFLKDNQVPRNLLHDKGFVSIGCAPCTRAILPGEPIRAGRWWWEDKSKKECGLHER
jgi:phosphoadenosine phosphosulfate reductase